VWKPGGDITFDPLSSVDRNMHAVSDGKLLVVLVKGAGRDFAHVTAPPPPARLSYMRLADALVFICPGLSMHRISVAHRRISQTRASRRLRQVVVSARLAPSHASYRDGPELVWATGRLMSPDRGFGTSCLLHCGHLTVSVNSEDN